MRGAAVLACARAGLLVAALAVVAGSCEEGPDREQSPPDAIAAIRNAAVRTLAAGPASVAIDVSSATAAYSVRGAIQPATERFRVRARKERTDDALRQ